MSSASSQSALRIFAFSALATVAGLLGVLFGFGSFALLITTVLVVVEVIFSFDNAIVNAKVLERLSRKWQTAFLTVGMVLAIFGMRLLFPIAIVALAAHLSLGAVWDMALHDPKAYTEKLTSAHHLISAFGGAFLLMLCLEFFLNGQHNIVWWQGLERRLKQLRSIWLPTLLTVGAVVLVSLLNHEHGQQILRAGLSGVVLFLVVQIGTSLLARQQPEGAKLVGWAAFATFMYLQVLDASFSFDSVIGAFAITDEVVLIAIGLGIGALWVRSLTVYMVRRGTLDEFVYLEHGAYYTIAVLAFALFLGLFIEVPDIITGIIGLGIIGSAVAASVQERNYRHTTRNKLRRSANHF
jgi:uncharacterized protein